MKNLIKSLINVKPNYIALSDVRHSCQWGGGGSEEEGEGWKYLAIQVWFFKHG